MAYCDEDGTCEDALPWSNANFAAGAEDPRVVYDASTGYYWMYIYGDGSGVNTVYLYKSKTPLDASTWAPVTGQLPWHRNGCVILRPNGTHFVLYGEAPPLTALGIASTTDFVTYRTLNGSWLKVDPAQSEVVVEASTPPVRLSTGDYFFLYSAGTTGW
jgi:hypothetical protein